jgi:hypothetical protein
VYTSCLLECMVVNRIKTSINIIRILLLNSRWCHLLYDFMLESFKHKGHCVVMDSAYMGDAMCQVGREEWGMNMVGTCQTDRTGAGALGKVAVKAKEIVIDSHESLMYHHNTKSLLYSVWGDNNYEDTI